MITVRKLTSKGDEAIQLTKEEAEALVAVEEGRYFVVDATTKKVLKPLNLVDGQELMLIPRAYGGTEL